MYIGFKLFKLYGHTYYCSRKCMFSPKYCNPYTKGGSSGILHQSPECDFILTRESSFIGEFTRTIVRVYIFTK